MSCVVSTHLCGAFAVCYYPVTYEVQSESTFYSLSECQWTLCSKELLVKELLSRIPLQSLKLMAPALADIAPALSKEFLDIQTNYRVKIHSEPRTWHDSSTQSDAPYKWVLPTQFNHLASWGKWLSVRLPTKWLSDRIPLQSLKLRIWHLLRTRSSMKFGQTIESRFTLNLVRDIIITYNQM